MCNGQKVFLVWDRNFVLNRQQDTVTAKDIVSDKLSPSVISIDEIIQTSVILIRIDARIVQKKR